MSIRDEWYNRPAHLKHLSLAEYIAGQDNKVTPVPPTITPAKSSGGRPRHEPGKMNGLEKRYALYLETLKTVGEILEWRFEPLKIRLAAKTYWNPDFLVKMPDGSIELRETKGHWEDDARLKIKWAAKDFSSLFRIIAVTEPKRNEWKVEEFSQE